MLKNKAGLFLIKPIIHKQTAPYSVPSEKGNQRALKKARPWYEIKLSGIFSLNQAEDNLLICLSFLFQSLEVKFLQTNQLLGNLLTKVLPPFCIIFLTFILPQRMNFIFYLDE